MQFIDYHAVHFYIRFYSGKSLKLKDFVTLFLHFSELNEEKFFCPYRPERAEALAILIELELDFIRRKNSKYSAHLNTTVS